MALLKEDGSLDIERINKLPREDYLREIGRFTREQMKEYISQTPINESNESVIITKVDYKMEDLLAKGWGTIDDIYNILMK